MTEKVSSQDFLDELSQRQLTVNEFLLRPRHREWFGPEHIRKAVYSYVERPAKRLRPAVLLFSCGAAGGREEDALPAAAAVEVFHTWTLVHDDLIDNDSLRRGRPTMHVEAGQWAEQEFGYKKQAAAEYGRDISILAGDLQQAWSVCLLLECAENGTVAPDLVMKLVSMMESYVINNLIRGETLDVQFSRVPFESLSETEILEMQWLKTGVLLQFAALAGACIGSGEMPGESDLGSAIAEFTGKCGIAFQLQDDILGIVGDEAKLGKPVGSDLREGKRTIIALHALKQASDAETRFLKQVLGKRNASPADIEAAKNLLVERGGIEHAKQLAQRYLQQAIVCLEPVPDSRYKTLLLAWADYMTARSF